MVITQNKGYKLPLSKIQIIDLYISGQSCYKLATTCKCTPQTIFSILKKANIPRRSLSVAATKYTHDIHYFKNINTQAKAYFLGLLYADGNIFKNIMSISLQEQDKHILDDFKKILKYTGPLYLIKKSGNRKNQYTLSLTSSVLTTELLKHGVHPNKGYTLVFPTTLPLRLYNHFIRGYFDGDGCVYTNPKNHDYLFSLVATKKVLVCIQDTLIKELGLNKTKLYNPPKVKDKNLYILTYQGKKNVTLIREYLYKNATVFLQRKYTKFFSI